MISKKLLNDLEKLASWAGHFEARKKRAAERLVTAGDRNWCFAIIGLECDAPELILDTFAKIQRVTEPPGEVELATALKNKFLFSAVGRYSNQIGHEIVINRDQFISDQAAFTIAWWIISALRIKTLTEIIVPAVADYSWSTISALSDGACNVKLLEDTPRAKFFGQAITTSQSDVNWIATNITKFAQLIQVPKFKLAVESLTENHFSNSDRMIVATIWAGIEALFEIQAELSFRLAVGIASILEHRGSLRKELYQKTKKLYSVRSQAVHGGALTTKKLEEHIVEARKLLSRLLCHFIETGSLLSEDEINDLIFC